jgi:hypothetical protein
MARGRPLISVQLGDTSRLRGAPAQNMYATLVDGFDDTDNIATTVMVLQTAAAATMGSTLGGTYNGTLILSKVATTINQLSANQTALLQQMTAVMLHASLAMPDVLLGPPPFVGGSYNQGGFNQGGRFNQGCGGCNSGCQGRVHS